MCIGKFACHKIRLAIKILVAKKASLDLTKTRRACEKCSLKLCKNTFYVHKCHFGTVNDYIETMRVVAPSVGGSLKIYTLKMQKNI